MKQHFHAREVFAIGTSPPMSSVKVDFSNFALGVRIFRYYSGSREKVSGFCENPGETLGTVDLRFRYRSLLADAQWGSTRRIRLGELAKALEGHVGRDLLVTLGCDFKSNSNLEFSWVSTLLRGIGTHQPIKHLLLIDFIGAPIETFLNLIPTISPAAKSVRRRYVWRVGDRVRASAAATVPCPNPVCELYDGKFQETFWLAICPSIYNIRSNAIDAASCFAGLPNRRTESSW